MISAAEELLLEERICEPGDGVVIVAGVPPGHRMSTNLVKLHVVGGAQPKARS
jgi:pyruvate kinase